MTILPKNCTPEQLAKCQEMKAAGLCNPKAATATTVAEKPSCKSAGEVGCVKTAVAKAGKKT